MISASSALVDAGLVALVSVRDDKYREKGVILLHGAAWRLPELAHSLTTRPSHPDLQTATSEGI